MFKLVAFIVLLLLSTALGGQKYLVSGETFGQRYGIDPTGLLLWLDQSDISSYGDVANWYDLSGNAYHGAQATAGNQPAIAGADGLNGSTRNLDGGDYIDLTTHISNFSSLAGGTISLWFNVASSPAAFEALIGMSDKDDASSEAVLFVTSAGVVRFFTRDDGAAGLDLSSVGTYDDSLWHHAVFAVDANGNDLWVDSVSNNTYSTGTSSTVKFFSNVTGADSMLIGANQDSGGLQWYHTGLLASIQVFNRRLTAAEVTRLYLADKPRYGGL